MKKSELFLTALLVPLDLAMVVLAFLAAYYLRLNIGEVSFVWPFEQYLAFVASLAPFWLAIFAVVGLYSVTKTNRPWEEFGSIFIGVAGGTFLVIAWPFLTRQEFFSRLVVIYLFFLALLFVTIGRVLIRMLKHILYGYGIGVHRLIIVGTNSVAAEFVRQIREDPSYGMRLVGLLDEGLPAIIHPDLTNVPILGSPQDLVTVTEKQPIDDLLIAAPGLSKSVILELLELCEDKRISFKLSPTLLDVHTTNIGVVQLAGVPILEYKQTPLEGWGRILKRIVDIGGSLVGIIIFGPFMLLTALAVKLTSPGPIIYNNERVGDEGHFNAYKFRSMKIEYCTGDEYGGKKALEIEKKLIDEKSARSGPLYKIQNDPRLTPIGDFIRKTSLDELPQLFNVLRGEMSLVGPRPHQPREVAKYERHHRKLLHIKPGITGLAQISGRSDLDFEEEYRLDMYYIENWSLAFDFEILLKTPFSVLASRRRKAA